MEPRGALIAGSRFYRDFCARCSEPIRVRYVNDTVENYCEKCDPKKPPQLAEIQRGGGTLSPKQRARLGHHQQ